MNLIIEVGNTNIKWAVFNQNELIFIHKSSVNDPLDVNILNQFKISKCLLAGSGNVTILQNELSSYKPLLFEKKWIQNITFEYDSIDTLGADRVLNVYAASQLFPSQNNLVIDIGTCMTCSFIDANNTFKGGSISPGIKMRAKAMHDFTFQLPLVALDTPFYTPIGTSTTDSILSGIFLGVEAEINYRIELFLAKYSQINIILTGGDVVFLENRIKNKIFAHSNLTLMGMNYLLQTL